MIDDMQTIMVYEDGEFSRDNTGVFHIVGFIIDNTSNGKDIVYIKKYRDSFTTSKIFNIKFNENSVLMSNKCVIIKLCMDMKTGMLYCDDIYDCRYHFYFLLDHINDHKNVKKLRTDNVN